MEYLQLESMFSDFRFSDSSKGTADFHVFWGSEGESFHVSFVRTMYEFIVRAREDGVPWREIREYFAALGCDMKTRELKAIYNREKRNRFCSEMEAMMMEDS